MSRKGEQVWSAFRHSLCLVQEKNLFVPRQEISDQPKLEIACIWNVGHIVGPERHVVHPINENIISTVIYCILPLFEYPFVYATDVLITDRK